MKTKYRICKNKYGWYRLEVWKVIDPWSSTPSWDWEEFKRIDDNRYRRSKSKREILKFLAIQKNEDAFLKEHDNNDWKCQGEY